MDAHFSIPLEVRLFSESFKVPSFGKFISNIRTKIKDKYAFINYAFLGIKETLLTRKVEVTESDIAEFEKLKTLLSFVDSAISDTDNKHLLEIKANVVNSLNSLDEIIKISKERIEYENLKKNLYDASSRAISTHIEKYRNAI